MSKPLYIAVFSNQEKNYNDFGEGYLPSFHPVFSVSHDKNVVVDEIFSRFYNKEDYEITEFSGYDEYTFTIKYTDKRYKDVYAIYTLEVLKDVIRPSY